MDQWEFTYVDPFMPGAMKPTMFAEHEAAMKAKIAQLGLDGWEPVGPVSLLVGSKAGNHQHLMFKRKLVEG